MEPGLTLGRLDLLQPPSEAPQGLLLGCTRCYVAFAAVSGDFRELFFSDAQFPFHSDFAVICTGPLSTGT